MNQLHPNREREKEAFEIFNSKATKYNLKINLIDAEYADDNSKIIFFYINTTDAHLDFKDLATDLYSTFGICIDLRQVREFTSSIEAMLNQEFAILSRDTEIPKNRLLEEAIKDLIKKYTKNKD